MNNNYNSSNKIEDDDGFDSDVDVAPQMVQLGKRRGNNGFLSDQELNTFSHKLLSDNGFIELPNSVKLTKSELNMLQRCNVQTIQSLDPNTNKRAVSKVLTIYVDQENKKVVEPNGSDEMDSFTTYTMTRGGKLLIKKRDFGEYLVATLESPEDQFEFYSGGTTIKQIIDDLSSHVVQTVSTTKNDVETTLKQVQTENASMGDEYVFAMCFAFMLTLVTISDTSLTSLLYLFF